MTESNGHETILASTAIPGIFPQIKIKAKGDSKTDHFVDGGVLMNTPMSPAIRAKANEIHVIYFDPKLEKLTPDYLPNTLDTINRFLFVSVANLIKEDIQEVEKVNRQVAVASKIDLIIETLKKRHADDLDKKSAPVKDAIESAEKFVDELAKRKLVTAHNYYPSESLGGILGLLDFKRDRMQRLVDLGVKDTEGHDCKVNGCVIPE
jgi:predicted acylesterase/phospholipase RssA